MNITPRTLLRSAAALLVAVALPAALHAAPPAAKVSPRQAEAAAVARIPGKALTAKYEFEDGRWQYAVTVQDKKGQLYEVEVSASTGRVTATEKTSRAEEAQEAAADKKAAQAQTGKQPK